MDIWANLFCFSYIFCLGMGRSQATPAARNRLKIDFDRFFRFISVRNFIENRYILHIPIEFPGIQ